MCRLFKSFFIFLFMQNAYSFVAYNEKVDFKLLFIKEHIADVAEKRAIADFRYIVLGRGTSDGIFEDDHFSFKKNGNFAFRGICIRSELYDSLWLTYHNYRPETLELKGNYEGKKIRKYHEFISE